eukprot:230278-Chlamydomonas_euryale.AAC.6
MGAVATESGGVQWPGVPGTRVEQCATPLLSGGACHQRCGLGGFATIAKKLRRGTPSMGKESGACGEGRAVL